MKDTVASTASNVDPVRTCRSCGVVVGKDAPFGHCPRCLLELGFVDAPTSKPQGETTAGKLRFGDYELIEQVGRGGMGVVYKARQVSLNRTVALKMVLDSHLASPVVLRRFLIEAEAAAKLENSNIVPIYDISEVEGHHFFSMRLIDGESLEHKIRLGEWDVPKRGKTRFGSRDKMQEKIATLIATVARAVHYAHERGVLHRDLKPSNILIDKQGQPHLTDFGLAKISRDEPAQPRLTLKTSILGTPGYMPPEQASGAECTAASDIYSLGAILYELLVGKLPFEGPTPLETMRKTVHEDALHPRRANRAIDRDLATICLKCLEKDPLERYATANDLATDLERWQRHETTLARPAGVLVRSSRWVQRNRAGTAVIALLVFGLAFTLASLRHAKRLQTSKDLALASFTRAISQQIYDLGRTNSFYEITSEHFGYLVGREPDKSRTAPLRFKVGVFIFSNPLETVIGYGRLFAAMESPLTEIFRRPVRMDFRVYTDLAQACEHLLAGDIHFLRVDPATAVRLCHRDAKLLAQEGARNDVTVIFTSSVSGITNMGQLQGRSIAFVESNSVVTAAAKVQLLANGLCARDVKCVYLNGSSDPQLADPSYFESPEQGYFDRQCETVRQVIDYTNCVAGVARERQFRLKREGEWHVLARFGFPRHVWLGSPKVDAATGESFKQALFKATAANHERSRYDDSFGAGYEVGLVEPPPQLLLQVQDILAAADTFDRCITNAQGSWTQKK